jgi:hypothetical protein
MLRFKVGERAIYAVNWGAGDAHCCGVECIVGLVGPVAPAQYYTSIWGELSFTNTGFDYIADAPGRRGAHGMKSSVLQICMALIGIIELITHNKIDADIWIVGGLLVMAMRWIVEENRR